MSNIAAGHSKGEPRLVIAEPASLSVIAEVPVADASDVQNAVETARKVQPAWALKSTAERAKVLIGWRKAIVAASDDISRLISRENGKPLHEAWLHELAPLYGAMTWLAEESPKLLADRSITLRWLKQYRSQMHTRPRGLCAIVSPYNFPLLIPFADAAAALVAGCAVIIKPSEHTPLTAFAVAKLAYAAGLDPALLQILPGGPDVARVLLQSGVDEVLFTGNLEHGREVARQCAERLLPCTLELGGKACLIALQDADLDLTASSVVFGALANSGQSCIAVERVIVHRSIQKRLVDAIADRVRSLRQGDPLRSDVDLGALTSLSHVAHIQRQVDAAVNQGALLVCGGRQTNESGHFYLPTLLDGCTPDMSIASEETFGPVIPIVPVDSIDTALRIANTGASGLAAYIFDRDEGLLQAIARQVNASHILINDVLWSYICPEIPFGGHRQCGGGVVHGVEGLRAHTQEIHVGSSRLKIPEFLGFGFPYSRTPRQLLKSALRLVTH